MTRKEAIKYLIKPIATSTEIGEEKQKEFEAYNMAIEALSANYTTKKPNDIVEQKNDVVAEPTDLISRAEVHKTLSLLATEGGTDAKMLLSDAHEFIDELPSADRPSGEWEIYYPFMLSVEDQKSYRIKDPKEPIPDKRFGRIRCSVCKEDKHRGNNFCSNCGAKMGSGGLYYADNRLTMEWKLASEELPQSVGSYIVTCKDENGSVYVDYDFWTVADKFKYNRDKVTAWIPFPKPYRCSYGERKDNIT